MHADNAAPTAVVVAADYPRSVLYPDSNDNTLGLELADNGLFILLAANSSRAEVRFYLGASDYLDRVPAISHGPRDAASRLRVRDVKSDV